MQYNDIFKEYNIIDEIVKTLGKEIAIDRNEMIYLMELQKQLLVHKILFIFGGCGISLIVLTCWL